LPAAERREAERSEADRSAAADKTVAPEPPALPRPDPEVVANAKRRTFTAEYKLRILAEADAAAAQPGAIGALQRREGLYSSHLVTWRRERQTGILKGLTPHKRGPKSKRNPQEEEMQKLRRENQRLTEPAPEFSEFSQTVVATERRKYGDLRDQLGPDCKGVLR
jgi:transposase-like protein